MVEDWYVCCEHRGRGHGRRLYERLEDWFRSKACREVKSDTWASNTLSLKVHRALGFEGYSVVVRKRL